MKHVLLCSEAYSSVEDLFEVFLDVIRRKQSRQLLLLHVGGGGGAHIVVSACQHASHCRSEVVGSSLTGDQVSLRLDGRETKPLSRQRGRSSHNVMWAKFVPAPSGR